MLAGRRLWYRVSLTKVDLLTRVLQHQGTTVHFHFQMDFRVSLALVRASELSTANLTRKRLLARVRANVRGQVVGAREGARADATLERFVARVDTDVARELVGTRKAARAALYRARVRTLVDRRLARTVRVLARLHRQHLRRVGRWLLL